LATKALAVATQRAVTHFLFHQSIFYQKQYECRHPPIYFSLFPRLKIKLKGCHFDTNEVIEAESQAVLNTLTEQDFQDAFKKMAVFHQMAAPVSEIMDGSLYGVLLEIKETNFYICTSIYFL
jgi:hypothetical protein